MATYDMGSFIRQLRKEQNITQEQLCAGLCAISTLSKIERGQYTPSGFLFRALMERLGNYHGKYYNVFLNKDDFEMWNIMETINKAILENDEALSMSLLEKHWNTDGFVEGLGLQFMLNSKIALEIIQEEKRKKRSVEANSKKVNTAKYDNWYIMAHQALSLSIPNFKENRISEYMLSNEEIRAALCMAGSYFYKKEYEKAARILYQLMESLDKFCPDQREKARQYPNILSNLAEVLYELGRYDEAISVCINGWKFCVERGKSRDIPLLLSFYCKSLIEKGEIEKGKALLHQTYCVALVMGQKEIFETLYSYYSGNFGEDLVLCYKFPSCMDSVLPPGFCP